MAEIAEKDMADERLRKADLYLKLADRASSRFESRRSMEWKTNFGLWTLFAGASALVISSSWKPSTPMVFLLTIVSLCAWGAYSFYWLQYLAESFEREGKTAWFWERAASITIDSEIQLPKSLHPGNGSDGDNYPEPLVQASDAQERESTENGYVTKAFTWERIKTYHAAQRCEVALTLGLVLLFSGVLIEKSWSVPEKQSITFDGVKVEATKLEIQPK